MLELATIRYTVTNGINDVVKFLDCDICKVAGWGKTDSEIYFHGQTLKYPSKLRQVDVPIQNTRQCGKNYKQSGTFDPKSFQTSKSFAKLRLFSKT